MVCLLSKMVLLFFSLINGIKIIMSPPPIVRLSTSRLLSCNLKKKSVTLQRYTSIWILVEKPPHESGNLLAIFERSFAVAIFRFSTQRGSWKYSYSQIWFILCIWNTIPMKHEVLHQVTGFILRYLPRCWARMSQCKNILFLNAASLPLYCRAPHTGQHSLSSINSSWSSSHPATQQRYLVALANLCWGSSCGTWLKDEDPGECADWEPNVPTSVHLIQPDFLLLRRLRGTSTPARSCWRSAVSLRSSLMKRRRDEEWSHSVKEIFES